MLLHMTAFVLIESEVIMNIIKIYDDSLIDRLREILVCTNEKDAYKLFTSCNREKGITAVWYFDPNFKM